MSKKDAEEPAASPQQPATEASSSASCGTRRDLLSRGAACAAVGAAGIYAVTRVGPYLTPPTGTRTRESFVAFVDDIPHGGTLEATLPTGQRVQVTRSGDDFAGFSDVCPHLGCRVHWMPPDPTAQDENKRNGWFRCPCHEGWFGADGTAFAGPPKDANQRLERIDLVQRGGSLFVVFEETTA